jgi:hypothetical protein
MTDVALYARRILKHFPGYVPFYETRRPSWWHDDLANAAWGTIYGIYENQSDAQDGSMIVAEKGLALLREYGSVKWLPYSDIVGWEGLYKDPVPARSLIVKTRSGERIELPFLRAIGEAFAFVQFLRPAIVAHKPSQSPK